MRYSSSTTPFASLILAGYLVAMGAQAAPETLGRTYPLAEEDALAEIERRAAAIDWAAAAGKIDIRARAREGAVVLPAAEEAREYQIDLTYVLEFDIPDGKGGILYPKGYRFNPLEYVSLPYRIAVIGKGEAQAAWAQAHADQPVLWMTSGGDPYELTERLGGPVYLYTPEVAARIPVKAVPAWVEQKGGMLVVREEPVSEIPGETPP